MAMTTSSSHSSVKRTKAADQRPETSPLEHIHSAALHYHSSGQFENAERCYRTILAIDPAHADSLHLLGLLGYQAGKLEPAAELIRKAIELNPGSADYRCNLGSVLQAMGRVEEAMGIYRSALSIQPTHAIAHNNLGNALHALQRFEEAAHSYKQALQVSPGNADAHSNLGNVLYALGRNEEAAAEYEECLRLRPDHPEAHYNFGVLLQAMGDSAKAIEHYSQAIALRPGYAEAYMNRGNAFMALGKHDEAADSYRLALECNPDSAESHMNLGNILQQTHRTDEALVHYRRALELRPDFYDAHLNLGNLYKGSKLLKEAIRSYRAALDLRPESPEAYNSLAAVYVELDELHEAERFCRRALELKRDYVEALANLGNILYALGRLREAVCSYDGVLQRRADHVQVRFNRALSLLKMREFEAAWQDHECRFELAYATMPEVVSSRAQWRGEPLMGRRVLLHCEQGLGDSIQFFRYAAMVAEAGGKVILQVPPRLYRIAEELPNVEAVIQEGEVVPAFDLHCPLMSLPLAFGTSLETIPNQVPYLTVPEDAKKRAAAILWPSSELRVGMVWAGNPRHLNDRNRSIQLSALQTIFNVEGTHFFSLQMGPALEQLTHTQNGIADLAPFTSDMADTAAQIEHLDLVITVDTSVAHLAGALGKPVWILLSANSDWRWLEEGEQSPWYPSARLFRQNKAGDWSDVVDQLAASLRSFKESTQPSLALV